MWEHVNIHCRGRLNHGRHFTFRSLQGDMAITLMSGGVEGALASQTQPFMAQGAWLQVYLSQEKCKKVLLEIEVVLNSSQQLSLLPVCLEWQDIQLKMTVS